MWTLSPALIQSVLLIAAWGCALLSDARTGDRRDSHHARGGGEESRHRIASVPSAHTAPHWGSYPYRGASTNYAEHSAYNPQPRLQCDCASGKAPLINLCFITETYSQCMCPTLRFLGRTSIEMYNTAGDVSIRQTVSYIEGLRATCCR